MKASLLSPGVLSSIIGSRMVLGIIPGFYDYETKIDPSQGSNLGHKGCWKNHRPISHTGFLKKKKKNMQGEGFEPSSTEYK